MRKNTLMIAAAVAALTAGSTLAFAQVAPDSKNPASKSAPAEKMAPAAKPGGAERGTVGQGQVNKGGQAIERGEERGNKAPQALERNKPKSETTGQAPKEAAPQANPKQEKSKGNAEQKRFENNAQKNERNRVTTGQGAPENRGGAMENRREGGQGMQQNGVQQNRGTTEERGGVSGSTTTTERGGNVNLTTEQRTRIHTIIIADRSAPRIERADFDVRVGMVVPRARVRFAPLPTSIVEIEPAWRGYEYFLVGEEIVVVDPGTLRIVAVLPA